MSQYNVNERVMLIKLYYERKYPILIQRIWKTMTGRAPPDRKTITTLVKKFESTGSVLNDTRRSGRPIVSTSEDNVEKVKCHMAEHPTSSTRRTSDELNMSQSTVQRIVRGNLKLKPYRPRLIHELNEDDPDRRLEFCNTFIAMCEDDEMLINNIWWSDESTFKLSGEINRHNCVYWAESNPHETVVKLMKSPGLTVWAAISCTGIIGPFFFDGSVTGESYLNMLQTFFYPELERRHNEDEQLFMQDGAPPHYANVVRDWLDATFPGKWIGRRGAIDWPARSPDMTPADFFLWGHLKHIVYSKPCNDLETLKQNIILSFQELDICHIQNACKSVISRCRLCIDAEGGQFEHYK